jgi:hypothetical protein
MVEVTLTLDGLYACDLPLAQDLRLAILPGLFRGGSTGLPAWLANGAGLLMISMLKDRLDVWILRRSFLPTNKSSRNVTMSQAT